MTIVNVLNIVVDRIVISFWYGDTDNNLLTRHQMFNADIKLPRDQRP